MKLFRLCVLLFLGAKALAAEPMGAHQAESADLSKQLASSDFTDRVLSTSALATINIPENVEPAPTSHLQEDWSIRGQATYIYQKKNNFNSPYHSSNSLLNATEGDLSPSYTFSGTAFIAKRLWQGSELYYNPEIFQGTPFSGGLVGLGGIQNGELQKGMFIPYTYYTARAFVRQTIGLGAQTEYLEGAIDNHLGGYVDKNRVVLTYGKFASLDIFDKNTLSHEPRTQFLNFSLFSMGAYGYAADVKGFTYGLVAEWYQDQWIFKGGRLAVPTTPNANELDYTLKKDYVDQIELTHKHRLLEQSGALRALVFQQRAFMATYQDALNQFYQNPTANSPNILTARLGEQNKHGYGLNAEQAITSDIGLFARWSWNDGQTETQTLDISRSTSGGVSIKGTQWGRPEDTFGLGAARNSITGDEIKYLQLSGMTMFIGDSALAYKPEQIIETFYSFKAYKDLYFTGNLQRISNPAYNASRGPVNFGGLRVHMEF